MADIFISYASEDRSRVEPLAKALEDQDWSVFWDLKIPVGETWRQAITEELKAAKCAVVLWSRTSINSKWVHDEADEAQSRQILVPALIDHVIPPLGFRSVQSARLMNWAGESNHPELEKLLVKIKETISGSPLGKTEGSETPERRRTSNALKISMFAAIAVLLVFGIWWYISESQKKITNSIGMKFVLIPAGNFNMGSRLVLVRL